MRDFQAALGSPDSDLDSVARRKRTGYHGNCAAYSPAGRIKDGMEPNAQEINNRTPYAVQQDTRGSLSI